MTNSKNIKDAELRKKILKVVRYNYDKFKILLQNCRVVIFHRTNVSLTYNFLQTKIKIDKLTAWKIITNLVKFKIKDSRKRAALENFIKELRFKKTNKQF